MRKIPTLFVRDGRLVTQVVEPGCEWVLAGEGVPSRKYDGTCCAVIGGRPYKRMDWDAQKGPAPAIWLHHDFNPGQRSGLGWYPVGEGPEDWLHREAFARGIDDHGKPLADGTYELCGPKVNRNPECFENHVLVPHGRDVLLVGPPTFEHLREYLECTCIEGLVYKRENGDMAKIKRRDFGFKWPVPAQVWAKDVPRVE